AGAGVTGAAGAASSYLDPYAGAGRTSADYLNGGLAAGGDFNKQYSMADLQMDPGYQFRLQQGQQALLRSGAAAGGALGGSAAKDLINYNQGFASNEINNAFN